MGYYLRKSIHAIGPVEPFVKDYPKDFIDRFNNDNMRWSYSIYFKHIF